MLSTTPTLKYPFYTIKQQTVYAWENRWKVCDTTNTHNLWRSNDVPSITRRTVFR